MVVERDVGHDGAFIRLEGCHVLGVQQLSNAQFLLSHSESQGKVVQWMLRTQGTVVKQVWPGQRAGRAPHQSHLLLGSRELVKKANQLLSAVYTLPYISFSCW